ncbi:hypothetical protein [Bradyrhizobium australafricanum]|uniref:hypothetical protein n=1 Tax=Bradyrhizobium australafricanum TaxID=2821406 RepID=UPI001CE341CE|nr:hypothetical protein [Bradyrhizobium australafricanum]MCA6104251.1 hypothetical protein [Bradyrhizobium australafricanum]
MGGARSEIFSFFGFLSDALAIVVIGGTSLIGWKSVAILRLGRQRGDRCFAEIRRQYDSADGLKEAVADAKWRLTSPIHSH